MPGANVAEITAGHAEAHCFAIACGGAEIAGKVIHHLRHDAPPVDGVYRADAVLLLEGSIVLQCFHNILAIVKHAFNGDIVDVGIGQAIHLRPLEGAHFAVRR